MEKRLFIFVVLSIVVWGSYLTIQYFVNPPKPKPKPAAVKPDKEKVDNKQADDKQADDKLDKPAEDKPKKPADDLPASSVVRRRVTLGSLDPTSNYTLLVTFDNRGAAIERIEFNDKYHDLDDHSGYLGHLALSETNGGVHVHVVGPGTPAAIAGLKPGDVITAVAGTPVKKVRDFTDYLEKKTHPLDVVAIDLERGGSATTVTTTLTRRPLELIRPEDNSGAEPADKERPGDFGPIGPPSYRMTLQRLGDKTIATGEQELADLPSLLNSNWDVQVDEEKGEVTFTTQLSEQELEAIGVKTSLAITKTYRLATKTNGDKKQAFHLDYHLAIKNTGKQSQLVGYRQEGPNGLPLEGWWYLNKVHPGWAGAGARDIRDFNPSKGTHELIGLPKLVSEAATQVKKGDPPTHSLFAANDKRELQYLAVDAQYFASALLPGKVLAEPASNPTYTVDAAFALPLNKIKDTKWLKTTNTSFFLDSEAQNLAPGDELASDYVIFAGPKDADILASYQLDKLIEYGWFSWVVKPLKGLLHLLHWAIMNYGVAILLLTVMVRLCLLPFSIRQAKSAAVMQAMAPELAKLKEKYANDLEKQTIAQRELFAKHGVNPMGGCLLMFAQLPIFIGLYRCLATDIDLREAALIPGIAWASNLAGPDAVFRWKEYLWPIFADEGQGWLGPYFNFFPLITIFLFMVQQKLFTPPAITEEQKQQQKIMNFMTIFMGVMFYKVPAGLCIYFIASSLWGICERKFITKPNIGTAPALAKVPEKPDSPSTAAAKKPLEEQSWLERMMSMIMGMADDQLKESKSSVPRKKAKK